MAEIWQLQFPFHFAQALSLSFTAPLPVLGKHCSVLSCSCNNHVTTPRLSALLFPVQSSTMGYMCPRELTRFNRLNFPSQAAVGSRSCVLSVSTHTLDGGLWIKGCFPRRCHFCDPGREIMANLHQPLGLYQSALMLFCDKEKTVVPHWWC